MTKVVCRGSGYLASRMARAFHFETSRGSKTVQAVGGRLTVELLSRQQQT
jgi:hypothetical protein